MRLHHVAIIVSRREHAVDFYQGILGFHLVQEVYREERQSYKIDLEKDGIRLEIFTFPQAPARPSYPEAQGLRHLAFGVDDLSGWHEKIKNHGVQVEDIRLDNLTGKKFFFFPDPDNLPIEFYEN